MTTESFARGFSGAIGLRAIGDSVRTNAQGRCQLGFRSRKGLYDAVSVNKLPYFSAFYRRYAFITNQPARHIPGTGLGSLELLLGRTNTVDFKPNEPRTAAVRNRNTGYQRLDFTYRRLHGSNLDTGAYLPRFHPLALSTRFC